MKRQQKRYCLAILIITLVGSVWIPQNPAVAAPNNDQIKTLVTGNTEFALDLYARLRTEPGNLFLSPHSISTALAMTYAGARGETERQMADVLHLPPQNEQTHAAFAALETTIKSAGDNPLCTFHVANALWGQQSYGFLDDFLALNRKYYSAGFREVDFVGAPEQARRTINAWITEQTHQIIKELLRKGEVDPADVLILTNAIYFKGIWAFQFNPEHTRDAEFRITQTDNVTVSLMSQTCELPYYAGEELDLLELPYDGDRLSMVILLPKQVGDLEKLENSLNRKNLAKWLNRLNQRNVRVSLPRFKLDYRTELAETLAALGMTDAFSPAKADFSGMTGRRELFIGAVIHQARVEVNEQGTEAAAATAVKMKRLAAPPGLRRRSPLPIPDPR